VPAVKGLSAASVAVVRLIILSHTITHEKHFFRSALLILENLLLMFELSSSCEARSL